MDSLDNMNIDELKKLRVRISDLIDTKEKQKRYHVIIKSSYIKIAYGHENNPRWYEADCYWYENNPDVVLGYVDEIKDAHKLVYYMRDIDDIVKYKYDKFEIVVLDTSNDEKTVIKNNSDIYPKYDPYASDSDK